MEGNSNSRERILSSPSYWVEAINGQLYNAIIEFMEAHNMKQKDLARHLNISPGRVSQILNDGEINFSIEKIVDIALKIGKVPSFELVDKATYLRQETQHAAGTLTMYDLSHDEQLAAEVREPGEDNE